MNLKSNKKAGSPMEDAVDALLTMAPYARIAHHIPGRIRLKFGMAAKSGLAGLDIQERVKAIPGLLNHRLNERAGSLIVEYAPDIIAPSLWEEIIRAAAGDMAERNRLRQRLLNLWQDAVQEKK